MRTHNHAPTLRTLVEILRWRAENEGTKRAFTFVAEDGGTDTHITFGELDVVVRAVAARLQRLNIAGERVMVVMPIGLPFIAGFYGALYAGATAVPVFPPRPGVHQERFLAVLGNCRPKAILTHESITRLFGPSGMIPSAILSDMACVTLDECRPELADDWRPSGVDPDVVPAVLQYTSGSTGTPKGVVLMYRNLLHNLESMWDHMGHDANGIGLGWLPPYHDMGLIGGILQGLYLGVPGVALSPTMFLRKPARWLEAISKYGARLSGGPNFAYELCVKSTTPEQRAALDLSRWDFACCGAEPVRAASLKAFAEAFAPSGFRESAFYPCYGLAEATLFVTGPRHKTGLHTARVSTSALRDNRVEDAGETEEAVTLVSCGVVAGGQHLVIVDPVTRVALPERRVGEIWVSGPSVAVGYWENPGETERAFHARMYGDTERTYLRTGDLGFLHGCELYVTGRLKELIVVRGTNHYPHDIETTVQRVSTAFRQGRVAAITIEADGEERLIIVVELEADADPSEVLYRGIREAVAESHGLEPHAILFAGRNSIPFTSSGKMQRNEVRRAYLGGALETRGSWTRADARARRRTLRPTGDLPPAPPLNIADAESIEAWIIFHCVQRLDLDPNAISGEHSFARLGVDSLSALELITELEESIGFLIPSEMLYEHPTIRSLARHLASHGGDVASIGNSQAMAP